MKKFSVLNRMLLASTVLFAPSLVLAQPATEADAADAAEASAPAEEIVIRGRFIPEPMRETSEVATFLSTEDLARQGDDTAAAALTRLTGLSVVSDRFVFVRGLGDRYSSALLNGSPLPSPEPLRRTVPLDLFPSNVLSSAAVQKTFSPDLPGEFGGGIINLQTLKQPNQPFFNVKVSSGINTEATLRDGLYYRGGDYDWTTFDDGSRDVPNTLASALGQNSGAAGNRFSGLSDDQREALGESLRNSQFTVLQTGELSPDFEAEVEGGTSIDIGRFSLGLVAAGGYDSSWRTQRAQRQYARTEGVSSSTTLLRDEDAFTTTWDITLNALGSASLGWDDNEVTATLFYVRDTSKEAQITEGGRLASGSDFRVTEGSAWYERQLATLQLAGEHEFQGVEVDWRLAGSQSKRDAPYERSISRVLTNGALVYTGFGASGNQTRFSELEDNVISGGVDLKYTLPIEAREISLLAGVSYSNTVRDYSLDVFSFISTSALPADVAVARPDFLFSPDNIEPTRFVLQDQTEPDNYYKGGLLVNSYYAGVDAELTNFIRAAVGVRAEDARQSVRTFRGARPGFEAPVRLEEEYLLPAATITWNFAEDLQLRLGYSQTIARPQFRELARSPYIDPDTDREYLGNPALVDSELENYDARLEYYFGRAQFVTFGGFYKTIDKPIEEVLFIRSEDVSTSFINAPKATLYGVEAEYRVNFELPTEITWFADKEWLFAVNYTYTKSEIEASASDRIIDPLGVSASALNFGIDGATLQGTPEHIANLQFGYETQNSQLTVLAGWVDERVLQRGLSQVSVGGIAVPDVVEEPGVQLDLTYRRDFNFAGQDFTFGFNARNLLGTEHREYQSTRTEDVEVNTFDRGTSYSVSFAAKF